MSDRADSFEWAGGHAALDFVNTVDERPFPSPIENLATYADLVKFVELAGTRRARPRLGAAAPRRRSLLSRGGRCPHAAGASLRHLDGGALGAAPTRDRFQGDFRGHPGVACCAGSRHITRAGTRKPLLVAAGDARHSSTCLLACHRASARRSGSGKNSQVRSIRLQCLLRRHQQDAASPLVQHEGMRKPREAETVALRTAIVHAGLAQLAEPRYRAQSPRDIAQTGAR